MHELLLFSTVASTQHRHILGILAGVAAMQPIALREQHLIFKPVRKPGSVPAAAMVAPRTAPVSKPPGSGSGGGSTGGGGSGVGGPGSGLTTGTGPAPTQISNDLFYLQLVGDLRRPRMAKLASATVIGATEVDDLAAAAADSWRLRPPEEDFDGGPPSSDGSADASRNGGAGASGETKGSRAKDTGAGGIDWDEHPWALEFRDLPDVPGKRPATSRLVAAIPIKEGSPREFVEGLGYIYTTSYLIEGDRLTHNDIDIRLFRTFPIPAPTAATPPGTKPVIPSAPDDSASLAPLDPSGGYILQASVRVQDGSKPELMARGFSELVALKDLLKGTVDLEPGDRLGLDTRLR